MALYLYFDEAGSFDFSGKDTAVFMIACVIMSRPFDVHSGLLDLKYDCLESGLDLERFHAAHDRQTLRDRVFELLSGSLDELGIYAAVVDKAEVPDRLRNPPSLYSAVFDRLLGWVACDPLMAVDRRVVAVTDTLPIRRRARGVTKALRTSLRRHVPAGADIRLYSHSSRSDLNLQVADYACWAVFRAWERGDSRSYRRIMSAVRREERVDLA